MKKAWILFLPVAFYFLGRLSNTLVCAVNGGFMPVSIPGGCSDVVFNWNHTCVTAQTHLRFLSDWIVMNSGIESPGDVLMEFGSAMKVPAFLAWVGTFIPKKTL